jgi:broad specificity phosphatase PhoE
MKFFMTLSLCFIGMLFGSCSTNIYLVRHAEKLNGESTSPLTAEGEQRAIALRDILKDKKIDSVFATDYKRTRMTAKPLADALGIPVTTYYTDEKFLERLKNMRGNVLVVGHSNTVPEIIKYITSEKVEISDTDFGNLYHIRIRRFFGTKISLHAKTYGTPAN